MGGQPNTPAPDINYPWCELCREPIKEIRDTVWYWDEESKAMKTKHKHDCQDLESKGPDFFMKRLGQLKHD